MAPDALEMAKYDDHPAVPLPVENPEHLASANSHTPGTGSTDEDDQSMVTSISEQDGGRDSTPEDPCCLEKTTVGSVITGNTGYDFIGLPRRNIRSVLEDSGPNWPQPCPQPLAEIWALPPATTIQHPTSFSNLSTTTLEATILKDKMSTITTTAWQTSFPPILPNSFNGNQPKAIRLFPLSNYTFGTKETQPEEDPSVLARLKRLEEHYEQHGMRRTCEGILVCHEHNHPHILMLQIANAFFKLPGDYLMPEDDEIEGFKSRLNERLAPVGTQFSGEGVNEEWEIGDTLAQWWRPNFETFMYPFIPAHVTRPKECKKLYFIQLPKQKVLSVPKNMKLLAVPLFELYDNTARYGPQLSAIPHLLSRYNFEFVDENGQVVACTPGSAPADGYVPKTKVLAGGTDEEMKEDDPAEGENGIQ